MALVGEPSSIQRLYNAALLGASVSKESGEASAESYAASAGEHNRIATLRAGVAAGTIKASSLGAQDQELLAQGLQAPKIKVPSVVSDPLGFVGGLIGNAASDVGSFASNPTHILQGIAKLGGDFAKELFIPPTLNKSKPFTKDIEGIGKSVVHDFSSPKQIYEHPLNPVLDVAGALSGGAGLAVKGARALSDVSKFGSLARGAQKVVKWADTTREPLLDPVRQQALERLKGLTPGGVSRTYSTNPFTRAFIQKPVDALLDKTGQLQIPGTDQSIQQFRFNRAIGRLADTRRARASTGANESFLGSPAAKGFQKAVKDMQARSLSQAEYVQKLEAVFLRGRGFHSLDQVDEYVNQLRAGHDELENLQNEGELPKMTVDEEASRDWRANTLYTDPRFRDMFEHPSEDMNRLSHWMDRLNVENGAKLQDEGHLTGLPPEVSERAVLGPFAKLTDRTVEEIAHELPPELSLDNRFARGLQQYHDLLATRGKRIEEAAPGELPTPQELAGMIPHGAPADREALMSRLIKSYLEDVAGQGSQWDRLQKPDYIAGKGLFQKAANSIHEHLGVPQEQAQAFARGIPLGEETGPILPKYIPSVGGHGAEFGVTPMKAFEAFRNRFLLQDQERAPVWHTLKRPYAPKNLQVSTVALGPSQGYLRDAEWDSFLNGTMRVDPETIMRNAFTIHKDILGRELSDTAVEKIALKKDGRMMFLNGQRDLELIDPKLAATHTVVPISLYRSFFQTAAELGGQAAAIAKDLIDNPEEVKKAWEDLADEKAHEFIQGIREDAGIKGPRVGQGVALPNAYIKRVMDHMKVAENGNLMSRLMARFMSRWKFMQLAMMPSWLLRTTIGHGLIALVDGTMPLGKYSMAALKYGKTDGVMSSSLHDISWGEKYGNDQLGVRSVHPRYNPQPLPPGVNQGTMIHELEDVGRGKVVKNYFAKNIQHGVHDITNFQRRAIFLRKLDIAVKQHLAELGKSFDHPGGFWNFKNIDAALDPAWREHVMMHPDLMEHLFDQLSHVSYTFGDMSPWERKLIKMGIPFWGWYKFISKFTWSMPLNYPGRAAALEMLGKIGAEDTSSLGPIPSYLEGALWLNHPSDLSKAKYINLYGMNPFADILNPFGKEGLFQGSIRLGQMSPLIQAAMAAYGINPITGGLERVDPKTGYETDRYGNLINVATGEQSPGVFAVHAPERFIGALMREFPEARALELLENHGNPGFPESIPLIDAKPIAVNPLTRRGGNWGSALQQEFGFQVRNEDLAKFQADRAKSIAEAISKNRKTLTKEQTKIAEPTP